MEACGWPESPSDLPINLSEKFYDSVPIKSHVINHTLICMGKEHGIISVRVSHRAWNIFFQSQIFTQLLSSVHIKQSEFHNYSFQPQASVPFKCFGTCPAPLNPSSHLERPVLSHFYRQRYGDHRANVTCLTSSSHQQTAVAGLEPKSVKYESLCFSPETKRDLEAEGTGAGWGRGLWGWSGSEGNGGMGYTQRHVAAYQCYCRLSLLWAAISQGKGWAKRGEEEEDLRGDVFSRLQTPTSPEPNLRKTCGASGYNTDQSNELSMPVPRGVDEGRKGRPWVSHRVSGEKVRRKGRRTGA